jgi:hypothetical protein
MMPMNAIVSMGPSAWSSARVPATMMLATMRACTAIDPRASAALLIHRLVV